MTLRVGVELADRVAGLAAVAGHLCVRDPQPAQPLSLLYVIGLQDPLYPFAGGPARTPWGDVRQRPAVMDSVYAWMDIVKASDKPHTLQDVDGVRIVRYGPGSTGKQIQLCTIADQGHEWPGQRRVLPKSISGPQTDKIDATELIWGFYEEEMRTATK